MTTTRQFHLGDVLTVTTGLLVSPGHVAAVHEMLGYLTGDVLMTHQLPRAMEECKPELLRQHPDLAAVEAPAEFDGEPAALAWLAEQVARFGEHRELAPMASEDHTRINPLAELAMRAPHMQVIPVVLNGTGGGGQPTGCTCPQVEVTPWPGYPAVEREFIPGQPDPWCPEHGEGSEG